MPLRALWQTRRRTCDARRRLRRCHLEVKGRMPRTPPPRLRHHHHLLPALALPAGRNAPTLPAPCTPTPAPARRPWRGTRRPRRSRSRAAGRRMAWRYRNGRRCAGRASARRRRQVSAPHLHSSHAPRGGQSTRNERREVATERPAADTASHAAARRPARWSGRGRVDPPWSPCTARCTARRCGPAPRPARSPRDSARPSGAPLARGARRRLGCGCRSGRAP